MAHIFPLAVGAGQMDDRVRMLGVAEQFGERADPPEACRHPMLWPACRQGGDDVGVGLLVRHSDPSLRYRGQLTLKLSTVSPLDVVSAHVVC